MENLKFQKIKISKAGKLNSFKIKQLKNSIIP